MTWRKYFTPVSTTKSNLSVISGTNSISKPGPARTNYSSYLPDVYSGSPNRIDRYQQYEVMDSDPEINAALDILAEFCTQKLKDGKSPFTVKWRNKATNSEVRILAEYLQQWNKLQQFDTRIFRIVRNTFKYGDSFFIRDPETQKWHWIDPSKIVKIIVNESDGKAPEQYVVKDLAPNFENLVVTQITPNINPRQTGGGITSSPGYFGATGMQRGTSGPYPSASSGSRFGLSETEYAIDSEHMVHLSLSEGLDNNYPFGNSLLENIFKVYKQKELLEDAILIYRIQRAPERRVFHIDVGNMPSHMAMAFVERVKNEIHQRRIPTTCLTLDTKIPLLDGRILELNEIIQEHESGKQNWVYSCNPATGEVVPGIISWAGVTGKNKQVMRLTLDNGKEIICTPEHSFPILGKGFVKAKDLAIGESFIPGYFREKNVGKKTNTYKQIFDNYTKKWKFAHKLVGEYFRNSLCEEFLYDIKYAYDKKTVIHHKDFNKYNNNPENLYFMALVDHFKYHSDITFSQSLVYPTKLFDLANSILIKSMTNEILSLSDASKILNNNQKFIEEFIRVQNSTVSPKKIIGFTRNKLLRLIKVNGFKNWTTYTTYLRNTYNLTKKSFIIYKYDEYLFDIFKEYYFSVGVGETIHDILNKLQNDYRFTSKFNKLHPKNGYICIAYINGMLLHFGYKNFIDFRKQHPEGGFKRKIQSSLETYNLNYELFDIIKKVYYELGDNLHYTQKSVGFKRLYRTLQSNQKFIDCFNSLNPMYNKKRFGPDLIKRILTKHGFFNFEDFKTKSELLNHKLIKVEYLNDLQTVGTITVDRDEQYHNYHTFLLDSGVFTKNSGGGTNVIDSAYNALSINEDFYFPKTESGRGSDVTTLPGGCFAMDTEVPLLDGRELSISEIAEELKTGQELWTYSCNPLTGEIVPGLISWAGVTQHSAKVMKITLDNDKSFICTPEHKLVSRNEGFKRADEMVVGDSLMPLYRKRKVLYNNSDYEQTFDNSKKKWRNTHRIVAEYLKDEKVLIEIYNSELGDKNHYTVHHKNFNRFNNDPNNLCFMNQKDHFKYHSDNSGKKMIMLKETNIAEYNRICQIRRETTQKFWNSLSIEEKQVIKLKMKEGIERLSKEEKELRDQRCRDAFKKGNRVFNEMMNSDPEFYTEVMSKRMKYWTEENRKIRSENTRIHNYKNWSGDKGQLRREKHIKLQSVEYTHDMLLAVIDLIKGKSSHEINLTTITNILNNDQTLLTKLTELNQYKKVRNWNVEQGFTENGVKSMVKQFGYNNWHNFRVKESIHNHRITKIEYLDDPIEVGTLTIDQNEIYHDYHTFALSAGVMVKNSNLGEIDDLRFFTNKLFRGLRIPSSYLPTGAEDSQTAFNDGRVGTAYIQELRFNKYCERLQSLITEVFDIEFKMYMYTRGLNIDANLFELQFNPPMNFASTRQATIDAERINTFNTIQAIPFMSNRFALKRFLGLTDEELAENERLWAEENGQGQPTYTDAAGELRGAGLSVAGIEGDLGMAGDLSAPEDIAGEGELGSEMGMGAIPPVAPATATPPPM